MADTSESAVTSRQGADSDQANQDASPQTDVASHLEESEKEPQKSYERILIDEIVQALGELERPTSGLVLSSLSAGLDVGFSVLVMAVLLTLLDPEITGVVGGSSHAMSAASHILVANAYAVGFIFVIIGRSELFTEHTTLAVFPVLDRRATVGSLARLWGLVLASNLIGAAGFALLISQAGPSLGAIDPAAFGELARAMTDHSGPVIGVSAVLAGWLMGLLSWLIMAVRDTISQIVIVWLVTAAIGLAGLHHSIVGTVEVLSGLFAGQDVTVTEFIRFLAWSVSGNAVGGVVFVALIKYGHSVRGD